MPQDTKPKPNPLSLITSLFKGNKTKVAIKEQSKDIVVIIEGIPQKTAILHIKNLFEELLNE